MRSIVTMFMKKVLQLTFTLFLAFYFTENLSSEELSRPIALLDQASLEFEHGNYKNAVDILKELLYPLRLTGREDILKARKLYAISLFYVGRLKDSRQEFIKILVDYPSFNLDPFLYPPKVVNFFKSIKESVIVSGRSKGKAKQNKKKKKKIVQKVVIEKRIVENIFLLNFFPFGVPQFQNNQHLKAYLFMSSQLIAISVNLLSFLLIERYRSPDGYFYREDYRTALLLRKLQFISLGIFTASYIGGVVDGLLNFRHERTLTRPLISMGKTNYWFGISLRFPLD